MIAVLFGDYMPLSQIVDPKGLLFEEIDIAQFSFFFHSDKLTLWGSVSLAVLRTNFI